MAIPESFLDELRRRNKIEEVVGRYVHLKRGGSRRVGLCPFHSEKTPSFTVFSDTQSFFCFGCNAGGDVINFIQRAENLDWIDALRLLAEQTGMSVPEDGGPGFDNRLRDKVLQINKAAAQFFHDTLNSNEGQAAREYLLKRRIPVGIIKRFGLGFAPDAWDKLKITLLNQGYNEADMTMAGLIIAKENKNSYDRFRNRVIFPIIDVRGNVIGFGGRVLDDSLPKYLNSPDTIVFKKSLQLFALNYAKNEKSKRLILAEGYMDVIALHQGGFQNAVATLGTAITQDQARLMARYAEEVVIAYDSDEAGQKAAKKAITLLTAAGLAVKVISLSDGKDPDEYIKIYGAEQFRRLLDESDSHILYQIERAKHGLDITLPDNKVEFLKRAAEILCGITSIVEREVYAGRIAEDAGISKESLLSEVAGRYKKRQRARQKSIVREETSKALGQKDKLNPQKKSHPKAARSEEGIIAFLLRYPDKWKEVFQIISPSNFITEFNRNMYEALITRISEGKSIDIESLSGVFSAEEMAKLSYCLNGVVFGDDILSQLKEFSENIQKESEKIQPNQFKELDRDALRSFTRQAAASKK